MNLVCEFLKTNSLKKLIEQHNIQICVQEYKFSLDYKPKNKTISKLAQDCHGLVLRTKNKKNINSLDETVGETVVLARPFSKFFFYGQNQAKEFDFGHPATAFYEKLDGILCIVYYDDVKNQWHVATRSHPEASESVAPRATISVRKAFEKALKKTIGKEFDIWASARLFRDTTYMFELTTPMKKNLIKYEEEKITLLAARKTSSGKELNPAFVQAQIKTPTAERYRFDSIEQLLKFVKQNDPKKHGGIVVCDQNFRRVKIVSGK